MNTDTQITPFSVFMGFWLLLCSLVLGFGLQSFLYFYFSAAGFESVGKAVKGADAIPFATVGLTSLIIVIRFIAGGISIIRNKEGSWTELAFNAFLQGFLFTFCSYCLFAIGSIPSFLIAALCNAIMGTEAGLIVLTVSLLCSLVAFIVFWRRLPKAGNREAAAEISEQT